MIFFQKNFPPLQNHPKTILLRKFFPDTVTHCIYAIWLYIEQQTDVFCVNIGSKTDDISFLCQFCKNSVILLILRKRALIMLKFAKIFFKNILILKLISLSLSRIFKRKMKYSELERRLKQHGCRWHENGSRHPIWFSPITGNKFPMSYHKSEEVKH